MNPTDHPSNPPSQGPGCPMCHGSRTRQTLSLGIGDVSRTVECEVCIYADSALAAQEARHKAVERERDEARQALWDVYREIGCDTDGEATPRSVPDVERLVISEARGFRLDYDTACKEAGEAESKLREATVALDDLRHAAEGVYKSGRIAAEPFVRAGNVLTAIRSGPAQQAADKPHQCEDTRRVAALRESAERLWKQAKAIDRTEDADVDPPEQETPKPRTSLPYDPPPCWCGRHRDSLSHSLGNFGGALFLHEYKPASAPPAHGGGD